MVVLERLQEPLVDGVAIRIHHLGVRDQPVDRLLRGQVRAQLGELTAPAQLLTGVVERDVGVADHVLDGVVDLVLGCDDLLGGHDGPQRKVGLDAVGGALLQPGKEIVLVLADHPQVVVQADALLLQSHDDVLQLRRHLCGDQRLGDLLVDELGQLGDDPGPHRPPGAVLGALGQA